MIEVELSDFEFWRKDLLKYASSLLYTCGFGNFKKGEISELCKDIVQDTYLEFHKHHKDPFVSKEHLYNFIKLCLYRKYLNAVNLKRSSYNTNKDNNITEEVLNRIGELSICEDFDLIGSFLKKLNQEEKLIVMYLLEGYNQKEISELLKCNSQHIVRRLSYIRDVYENKVVLKEEYKGKKVEQIDHNGVIVQEWDSGLSAANKLDLSASAISNCCKGKRNSHGGFKWKFKEIKDAI